MNGHAVVLIAVVVIPTEHRRRVHLNNIGHCQFRSKILRNPKSGHLGRLNEVSHHHGLLDVVHLGGDELVELLHDLAQLVLGLHHSRRRCRCRRRRGRARLLLGLGHDRRHRFGRFRSRRRPL